MCGVGVASMRICVDLGRHAVCVVYEHTRRCFGVGGLGPGAGPRPLLQVPPFSHIGAVRTGAVAVLHKRHGVYGRGADKPAAARPSEMCGQRLRGSRPWARACHCAASAYRACRSICHRRPSSLSSQWVILACTTEWARGRAATRGGPPRRAAAAPPGLPARPSPAQSPGPVAEPWPAWTPRVVPSGPR